MLTANPEPYAEFFDVILLGDGEGILADFTQAMHAAAGGSGTREELLISLSQVDSASQQRPGSSQAHGAPTKLLFIASSSLFC